jgi:histidine ammonia-lyase
LGRGTAPAYDLIRQHVPFLEQDAVMYPYIEAVRLLIANGDLGAAVTAALARPGEHGGAATLRPLAKA